MAAYYNEFDKNVAQWLRNLIKADLIAPGDVDERSVLEVSKDDLKGYTQCHFFAGIGGWSYALRLAGWPDDQEVWTGSCPCQPFSVAGKGKGFSDERHLWPIWRDLIEECSPSIVFGEQVASKAGRSWLSVVRSEMETLGYGLGAADLCAASAGASHIRQRLWWVANADGNVCSAVKLELGEFHGAVCQKVGWPKASNRSSSGRVGGFWRNMEWREGKDKRYRPIESGTFPLVDGFPRRLGQLRAYGNAIVPQLAAEFIQAFTEVINGAD